MEVREALEQLEQLGHAVEYGPVFGGNRLFYHVDGIPRTADEILKWVVDGVRPRTLATASGMTIQEALTKLSALGHVIEPRPEPTVRDGEQYFRIDGQFSTASWYSFR